MSRKAETSGVPESLRSSGSSFSSFTHVSAIADDALTTPHTLLEHASSLLDQAAPSPTSSVTLTPTSSRDLSGSNHIPTPTSLPLPPATPNEDEKTPVATPPPLSRPGNFTSSSSPDAAVTPVSSRSHDARDIITSPTPNQPQDFTLDKSAAPLATSETLDDMFAAAAATAPQNRSVGSASGSGGEELYPPTQTKRRAMLQSTGSSSSTSLEISDILSHVRKADADNTTAAGGNSDAAGNDMKIPPLPKEYAQTLEEIESATEDENAKYSYSIWPRPPDVPDVSLQAQRLAAEAIHHRYTGPRCRHYIAVTTANLKCDKSILQNNGDESISCSLI